jgi:hypothetical protein
MVGDDENCYAENILQKTMIIQPAATIGSRLRRLSNTRIQIQRNSSRYSGLFPQPPESSLDKDVRLRQTDHPQLDP